LLRDRKGSIKAALMDQQLIAGIGNIYSDEIFFQARLDPRADARSLDAEELGALHRAMRRVLATAIAAGAQPDAMPDGWLINRRQKGAACPRCEGTVQPLRIAGRTAWFCPRCQSRRKRA
jgi:formamidopyrimidine-DNA glycosylase